MGAMEVMGPIPFPTSPPVPRPHLTHAGHVGVLARLGGLQKSGSTLRLSLDPILRLLVGHGVEIHESRSRFPCVAALFGVQRLQTGEEHLLLVPERKGLVGWLVGWLVG